MKNELIEIETATGIEIYNITPQVIDILTFKHSDIINSIVSTLSVFLTKNYRQIIVVQ